ncbi:MAG: LolA family protein [Actinomycetota bacterium]
MRSLPLLLFTGCLAVCSCSGVSRPALAVESPESVLARAEARFAAIKDYQCIVEAEARKGKKHESGSYQLWFRKPSMLRIHVTKGKTRGSDLAIDERGKVRGRQGGLLKPFVITLSPKDKRLRNLRGYPVTEIQWGAFYNKLRTRAALPGARLTLADRSAGGPYQLTLRYVEAGKQIREEYRFDPDLWVLTLADYFEDEERVDHVLFRDIRLDPGLESRFFRL